MPCPCESQKSCDKGGSSLRKLRLGKAKTLIFDDFLVIGFSKKWVQLNDDKPIEFDVELKKGKLVLSGSLLRLNKTREVDTNAK